MGSLCIFKILIVFSSFIVWGKGLFPEFLLCAVLPYRVCCGSCSGAVKNDVSAKNRDVECRQNRLNWCFSTKANMYIHFRFIGAEILAIKT